MKKSIGEHKDSNKEVGLKHVRDSLQRIPERGEKRKNKSNI